MERVPGEVKLKILQPSHNDEEQNKGIALEVPKDWRSAIRDEMVALMCDSGRPSFLKVLIEEFGFVVLNLTLLKSQRKKLKGVEVLEPSRNYSPLIWHKDGGIKHLAPFSFLFTDTSGPRRLSKTAISEVRYVFPSLIWSCDSVINKLQKQKNSRWVVSTWRDVKKRLESVLVSTDSPDASRQLEIRNCMEKFLNALKHSMFEGFLDDDDYRAIVYQSIEAAGNEAYVHHWQTPQTLVVSSQKEFIHCRVPAEMKKHERGGILYARAVRQYPVCQNDS